jgi:LmbE family N-acetylglucosaminyl deacetylase
MRGRAAPPAPGATPCNVGHILAAAAKAPASDLHKLTLGKPILVIAPHPDDEVLGCGGLLAACAAAGVKAHVAFLTDGSLSHPGSASWSQKRIAVRRAAEAMRAAQTLGLSHRDLTFLNKRDGRLLFESAQMMQAGGQLARLARRMKARTIFVTWRHDPHPDHIAAALIADHVRRAAPHLRVFHYPIWSHLLPRDVTIADGPWRPIRLDVRRWLNVKRRALTAYRTQTSTLIADAPITLRLQRDQLDTLMTRSEIFLRQN